MGKSLVLKTADFSESGFKLNQILLNYMSGTIEEDSLAMTYDGVYSATVLRETIGITFNRVSIAIANSGRFNVCKYNSTSKEVTVLKTVTGVANETSVIDFDNPVELGSDEYLAFAKNDSVNYYVFRYTTDQGKGKTFAFVSSGNGELTDDNNNNYYQPRVKVEMIYN